jgi:ribulose-5-phosphate 4-epimerase/fuculose-1-phosphate aldolase
VILSQHGLLAWGETLEEAVNYTLILEKLCHLEYLIRTGQ